MRMRNKMRKRICERSTNMRSNTTRNKSVTIASMLFGYIEAQNRKYSYINVEPHSSRYFGAQRHSLSSMAGIPEQRSIRGICTFSKGIAKELHDNSETNSTLSVYGAVKVFTTFISFSQLVELCSSQFNDIDLFNAPGTTRTVTLRESISPYLQQLLATSPIYNASPIGVRSQSFKRSKS